MDAIPLEIGYALIGILQEQKFQRFRGAWTVYAAFLVTARANRRRSRVSSRVPRRGRPPQEQREEKRYAR